MPDVQIDGTNTTLSFPDSMQQADIAKVMSAHPVVQQLRMQGLKTLGSDVVGGVMPEANTVTQSAPPAPVAPSTPSYMAPAPNEGTLQKYTQQWLASDGVASGKPYQLMLKLAALPEPQRAAALPPTLSPVGKQALLRFAYQAAGTNAADPTTLSSLQEQGAGKSVLQKAGAAAGHAFQSAVQPFVMGGHTAPSNPLEPLSTFDAQIANLRGQLGTAGAKAAFDKHLQEAKQKGLSHEATQAYLSQFADPNFLANFAPGAAKDIRGVPVVGGIADFATSLASPSNLGLMGAAGAAAKSGTVAKAAARVAGGAFAGSMLKGGVEQVQQGVQDIQKNGYTPESANNIVKGVLSLGMGVHAGTHAAAPSLMEDRAIAGQGVQEHLKSSAPIEVENTRQAQMMAQGLKKAGFDPTVTPGEGGKGFVITTSEATRQTQNTLAPTQPQIVNARDAYTATLSNAQKARETPPVVNAAHTQIADSYKADLAKMQADNQTAQAAGKPAPHSSADMHFAQTMADLHNQQAQPAPVPEPTPTETTDNANIKTTPQTPVAADAPVSPEAQGVAAIPTPEQASGTEPGQAAGSEAAPPAQVNEKYPAGSVEAEGGAASRRASAVSDGNPSALTSEIDSSALPQPDTSIQQNAVTGKPNLNDKLVSNPSLETNAHVRPEPAADITRVDATGTPAAANIRTGRVAETEPQAVATQPAPASERAVSSPNTPADTIMSKGANAHAAEERQALGLEELPPSERKGVTEAFQEAQKSGAAASALSLAQDVVAHPRNLSDNETAGLMIRIQQVKERVTALRSEIEQAASAGDIGRAMELRAQHQDLLSEYDTLDQARKVAGREWARSGLARQIEINNYDYTGVRSRMVTADPSKPLTPMEDARVGNLTRQLDEANKRIAEQDQKLKEAQAQRAVRRMANEAALETRKAGRAQTRQALDKELDDLKTQFVKKAGQLNAGLDPELASLVGKMAKNRVKAGVVTMQGLVDEIHAGLVGAVPDLQPRDIRDAISRYGQQSKPGDPNSAEARLRDLQKQMRLVSAIEDAKAKTPPAKGTPPGKPSPEVVKLQAQLDAAMEKAGLKPKPEPPSMGTRQAVYKKSLGRRIDDLNQRIKDGNFNDSQTPTTVNRELYYLKAQAARLKARYDAANPTPETPKAATPADRLLDAAMKRTQARIDTLQAKVANKDVSTPPKQELPPSSALYKLQQQRAALQTQYDAMKPASEGAAQSRLKAQIADLDRRIKTQDFSKPTPKPAASSPAIDALKAQRDALKAQYDAIKPESTRDPLPTIKKRLQGQIADLQKRIDTGSLEGPEKKPPTVYDAEANKLKEQRDRLKYQIDQMIAARQKPTPLDYLTRWQRFSILSGVNTLGKLSAAASGRVAVSPLEEMFGGAISKAVPGLAAQAPREGGANVRAEVEALEAFFSKATLTDMKSKMTTGAHSLDVQYGEPHAEAHHPFWDFFGGLHGALKTPAQRAEFYRAFTKRAEFAAKQGLDLKDPAVQMQIGGAAYADSKRAILMGDNVATNIYRNFINFSKRQGPGGRAIATGAQIVTPIVKVPTNYVSEAANYVAGGPIGAGKLLAANVKNEGSFGAGLQKTLSRDMFSKLTPDQSDAVMRAFKKGGLGAGLLALGYFAPNGVKAGGYYQKGHKDDSIHPGDLQVGGMTLPHLLAHTPALEAIQMGATIRRAMDGTRGQPLLEQAGSAAYAGGMGLAKQTPFIDQPIRLGQAAATEGGVGRTLGDITKSILVPQGVQQAAKGQIPGQSHLPEALRGDVDAQGNTVSRKARGFTEAVKEGVPGLRQTLPVRTPKGSGRSSRAGSMTDPGRQIERATRIPGV